MKKLWNIFFKNFQRNKFRQSLFWGGAPPPPLCPCFLDKFLTNLWQFCKRYYSLSWQTLFVHCPLHTISLCLYVCLYLYVSISLSLSLSLSLCLYLFVSNSISLSFCLCLSISSRLCPCLSLSIWYLYLFVALSLSFCLCLWNYYLSKQTLFVHCPLH